jgi:hypothetical protein
MQSQQEIRDYLVACEDFLNDPSKRIANGLPLDYLFDLRSQLLERLINEQLRTFKP